MAIQTDDWNVVIEEWGGLHTARDSDSIPDGFSPNVLNVRITGAHVRGARGYELTGSRNSASGEITSKYTYKRNDGKKVMVRVRDTGSSGILEWYDQTNDEYYTLLSGLTTGKIMGFTEFNYSTGDEDVNQMLCCNGVENMSVWTGATTRLTAALVGGETTINVEDTTDFPSSGTIIYNGTEIAYSSKTATTFVVASAHASAGANDGVAQAIDDSTHSGITKGNILLSAKDRLWIAGIPASPLAFDYSDEGTALTFTGGANRSDSGSETALNIGGKITGLAEKGDEILILGEDGCEGFSFTYPTATTKAPLYREVFRSVGLGPLSSKSIVKINNEVYFANRNGITAISDLEGTEKVYTKSITRDILPTLKLYDFSEAASVFHEPESILLVSCKSDPDFTFNDIVIGVEFYRTKDGQDTFALTRFDWPVNDWTILENSDNIPELFFGSSAEMNSFKAFSTYENDGAPRTIRYATKRYSLGDPFQRKQAALGGVKGMIKPGSEIEVCICFDGGFKGQVTKTISSDGAYVSRSILNALGAFEMGTNPIGASIDEVSDFKQFLVYLDIGLDYEWSDIQMIFESDTDGGSFLLDTLAMAVDEAGTASVDSLTI